MSTQSKFLIISIIIFSQLVILSLYFKLFPLFISPIITNLSLIVFIFILLILIIYFTQHRISYISFLQISLLVFILAAIPNLRFSYPPLHDPYYHFACTLNILQYGTLDPVIKEWYWAVGVQLTWPDMHLISASIEYLTQVPLLMVFRYQECFIAILLFLSSYLFSKSLFGNHFVAILSSLFITICDINLFYLSEYHPQGLSIVYLMLFLFAFQKWNSSYDFRFLLIGVLFSVAFILSHYFTPLLWALVLSTYIVILFSYYRILTPNNSYGIRNLFYDYLPFIIFISLTFIYFIVNIEYVTPLRHSDLFYMIKANLISGGLITFPSVIILGLFTLALALLYRKYRFYLFRSNALIINLKISHSHGIIFYGIFIFFLSCILLFIWDVINGPSSISFTRYGKWLILILSTYAIINAAIKKEKSNIHLVIIYFILIFGSIAGYIVTRSYPLDRLIGFWYIVAAPLASLSLITIYKQNSYMGFRYKGTICLIMSSIIILAGIFSSQIPGFLFQGTEIDGGIWYSNIMPQMQEYVFSGNWTGNYLPRNQQIQILTDFHTRVLPFYFGLHSIDYIREFYCILPNTITYCILNPYSKENYDCHKFTVSQYNKLFDSKNINIYVIKYVMIR